MSRRTILDYDTPGVTTIDVLTRGDETFANLGDLVLWLLAAELRADDNECHAASLASVRAVLEDCQRRATMRRAEPQRRRGSTPEPNDAPRSARSAQLRLWGEW